MNLSLSICAQKRHIQIAKSKNKTDLCLILIKVTILMLMLKDSFGQQEPEEYQDKLTVQSPISVILSTNSECEDNILHMQGEASRYNLTLDLERSTCKSYDSRDKKGFDSCKTFYYGDKFTRLGNVLCIDLQGVPESIGKKSQRTQLRVLVDDRDTELKTVYGTTRLRPTTKPYLVCTNSDRLAVSLLVRDSVPMCWPSKTDSIMESLVEKPVYMGTVSLQKSISTFSYSQDDCQRTRYINSDKYLIKMDANDESRSWRSCNIAYSHSLAYNKGHVCIHVLYQSYPFNCDFKVSLGKLILFRLDSRSPQLPLCREFSKGEDVDLRLLKGRSRCSGSFVLSVNFTRADEADDDDDYEEDESKEYLRRLYMGVFISLISLCLVILAVTCVCCLRMRNKRARQAARRSLRRSRAHATDNEGFQPPSADFPTPSVSWSPENPDQIFGLPSYEEVIGQSSGVNPSTDSNKEDMPPSYDTLYTTDT